MHEPDHLFIDLHPPHGGLQRLQRHIHYSARRRRQPAWRIAAGSLALAMLVVASLLPARLEQHRRSAELTSTLRAAMATSVSGIRVTGGAAIELPSGHADVRVYLVQSMALARPPTESSHAK